MSFSFAHWVAHLGCSSELSSSAAFNVAAGDSTHVSLAHPSVYLPHVLPLHLPQAALPSLFQHPASERFPSCVCVLKMSHILESVNERYLSLLIPGQPQDGWAPLLSWVLLKAVLIVNGDK